jgi:hypothetical protein
VIELLPERGHLAASERGDLDRSPAFGRNRSGLLMLALNNRSI